MFLSPPLSPSQQDLLAIRELFWGIFLCQASQSQQASKGGVAVRGSAEGVLGLPMLLLAGHRRLALAMAEDEAGCCVWELGMTWM